ncbi:MAG TPA: SDR family NAD(P)-dependent oxidoreductase [Actinomycetota bacterium]|nr:SDR family NAD(P)-dependent oxidoreductase [Actinomycetota bacterium]
MCDTTTTHGAPLWRCTKRGEPTREGDGSARGEAALITGAGSGIGAATAKLFAAEGAAVSVVDVRAEAAEQVAEGIRRQGGESLGLGGDVSDPADVERFVAETVAAFDALHILHNHAGVLLECA